MSEKIDRLVFEAHADAMAVAAILDYTCWRFGRGKTASQRAALLKARRRLPSVRRAIDAALTALPEAS